MKSDEYVDLCEEDKGNDDSVFLIISGIIELYSFLEEPIGKNTMRDSVKKGQSAIKRRLKEEVIITEIHANQGYLPPLIDELAVSKILTLTEVEYFRIPKRSY